MNRRLLLILLLMLILVGIVPLGAAYGKDNAGLNAGVTAALINTLNNQQVQDEDIDVAESTQPYIEYDVPSNNSFKSYMDAKYITAKNTQQYKLKAKYELNYQGMYEIDGRLCVAVGSYYSVDVGTKIDLIMNNGSTVECILADCKADKDTDKLNRQNPNGSIVEFIVCERYLLPEVKKYGDCSYASDVLGGEIKAIRVYQR